MKNVVVLFGGKSVEREVSIITGVMTLNALNGEKYNKIPVLVTADGQYFTGKQLFDIDDYKRLDLKKLKKVTFVNGSNALYQIKGKRLKEFAPIYAVVNCMHGGVGEDGSVAGFIKTLGIPFASPCVLPSAVSMDKRFTKIVLKGLGVRALPYNSVSSVAQLKDIKETLCYPVIVKPNLLGSSIGIAKVDNKEQLNNAVFQALRYGESAIIEPCLTDFIEINCAVYRDDKGRLNVSECEQPMGKSEVLSFGDKYEGGKRLFPAPIDKKLSDRIKRITKTVYRECAFNGVIRIDYFIKQDKIYLNEINSVPGSLSYYLFSDTIKGFSDMLDQLISVAVSENAKQSTFITQYNSSILNGFGSKGAKRVNAKG